MSAYLTDDKGEMTAQLTRLLRDEVSDNCALMLEIIAGGGANKRLKGYLFGMAVAHRQTEVQNRAMQLLKQYATVETVQQATRLRNAVNYHYNEADYLAKYKNSEFDLFDFLLAYKMCNWHGLQNNQHRKDRSRLSHETLNLAAYPENVLSEAIATLDFVRYLILPHHKDFDLESAYPYLFMLPLESIYIENVRLARFPSRLFGLPQLKILSIKRGTYRPRHPMEVPAEIPGGSQSLEKLMVEGYALSHAEHLGPFPRLKTAYLVRCGLEHLQFLEQSTGIEEMCLKFNMLRQLPTFMGGFSALRIVDLSGNPFEKIELDLSRLHYLEELDLKMKTERMGRSSL